MKIAALQMVSSGDVDTNLAQASDLIGEAAKQGANWVLLPENFAYFGQANIAALGLEEFSGAKPITQFLAQQAKHNRIGVVGGAIPIGDQASKSFTASLVFDAKGQLQARYDKLHLFDVDVGDAQGQYRESDIYRAGKKPVCVDLMGQKIGLSIC